MTEPDLAVELLEKHLEAASHRLTMVEEQIEEYLEMERVARENRAEEEVRRTEILGEVRSLRRALIEIQAMRGPQVRFLH
jgi:hypothetical protein